MTAVISFGRRLTMLAEAAQPGDVAVIFAAGDRSDTSVTWHFLEARANQFARHLLTREIGVGQLVVIALPNSIEHLIASFGAWKAGASVLPLRYDLPAWERDRMLDLASPAASVANWGDGPVGTISTDELAKTVDLESDPPVDRVPEWSRVIASSGSTGRPKLIVTPSPGTMDAAVPIPITSGSLTEVQLGVSPLYHANGWYSGGPAAVLNGNLTVLMERFDASHVVDLIERYCVTSTILVPTMLMRIARLPNITERDLSSLSRVVYGGASIPEWVVRVWLGLIPPERFTFSYGGSEGLGAVRANGDEWLVRPGTTGRPQDCDLMILDEAGNRVPNGTVGAIYLRSHKPGPPFEYLGVPTPATNPDGFRTLGDLGWVDDAGYLYISDRRQDMIVTGGANVFPAEVEAALSEHPTVADQVVIGLEDAEWGHRVHAIVQLEENAAGTTADDLRNFCRDRLAAYKVPKTVEFVSQIPRTPAGKVNRGTLAEERTSPSAST